MKDSCIQTYGRMSTCGFTRIGVNIDEIQRFCIFRPHPVYPEKTDHQAQQQASRLNQAITKISHLAQFREIQRLSRKSLTRF